MVQLGIESGLVSTKAGKILNSDSHSLPIGDPPPAFGCVVYVRREDAAYHARVANLPDLRASGSSQRDVLGKIVAIFKAAVSEATADGGEPDWIEPPLEKSDDEQKLFLPVHL